MIGHPREQRLLGFLDARLPDRDRRRIAAHLAQCQRCRNVVQGHRTVRSVFQLEAPPAPGGVLERIIATRAGGAAMVLPVADPGHGRRVRGSVVALAVAAAAVMLLSVVQVVPVPMRPLADAWDWWSRTVVDWRPFAGGSGRVRLAEMLEAPIADPAVLHPERLRSMTATYRTIIHRGVERRPRVDTAQFALLPPSRATEGWTLEWSRFEYPDRQYRVALDRATLGPYRWTSTRDAGPRAERTWSQTLSWVLEGNRLEGRREYQGEVPEQILLRSPAGTQTDLLHRPVAAPYYFGQYHLRALMLTVALDQDWVGSFARLRITYGQPPWMHFESYFVDGSESVTTPAGTFDTWRVRMVESYRESTIRFWFRKADGLLVRQEYGPGNGYGTREELLAVSYP